MELKLSRNVFIIVIFILAYNHQLSYGQNTSLPAPITSLELTIVDDYYTMPLILGFDQSPQILRVAVDTGSSNLLFLGEGCTTCNKNRNFARHVPFGSVSNLSTNKALWGPLADTFTVVYDEGRVHAINWVNALRIDIDGVYVESYVYGVAFDDPEGQNHKAPPILGLAYDSEMTKPEDDTSKNRLLMPFMDAWVAYNSDRTNRDGPWKIDIFGMSLYDPSRGKKSQIDFGGVSVQPTMFMDVTKKTYYVVKPNSIKIGDWQTNFSESIETIVDSGTTDLVVPAAWLSNILLVIQTKFDLHGITYLPAEPKKGSFQVNATETQVMDVLSTMTFQLVHGEDIYEIHPSTYARYFDSEDANYPGDLEIYVSSGHDGSVILGQTFMQNFYTVFDRSREPNRVGFAPH